MSEVEYKELDTYRNFGVELEVGNNIPQLDIANEVYRSSARLVNVTGWAPTPKTNRWHVKYDSTCGLFGKGMDYGWEIASFTASGEKDLAEIVEASKALEKIGASVNKNCGLHVHVCVEDFDIKKVAVLLAWWVKVEQVICHAVPSHRVNNPQCRLVRSDLIVKKSIDIFAKYQPLDFWELVRPHSIDIHHNRYKKVSLNTVNFLASLSSFSALSKKTVELRLPDGTLNGSDIAGWVRVFLNFVESCKDREMPENLLRVENIDEFLCVMGLSHPSDFIILGSNLHSSKAWLLSRILKHGKNARVRKDACSRLNFMLSPEKTYSMYHKY